MDKFENDWKLELEYHSGFTEGRYRIEINKNVYNHCEHGTAALCHAILLLVDAVKEK